MDSRSFENESKNMEARSDEKFGQCLAKSVGNRRVYWIFGCWVYAPDDKTKTPVNVIARLTEREEPRSKNFSPLFFFHQLSSPLCTTRCIKLIIFFEFISGFCEYESTVTRKLFLLSEWWMVMEEWAGWKWWIACQVGREAEMAIDETVLVSRPISSMQEYSSLLNGKLSKKLSSG